MVKLGRYRHYKGGIYKVIALAKLESNHQDMVVYVSEEDSGEFPVGTVWVRPATEFEERVDGGVSRFQYLIA